MLEKGFKLAPILFWGVLKEFLEEGAVHSRNLVIAFVVNLLCRNINDKT